MFDWYASMIILVPAILLGLYAQYRVKAAFGKYSKVRNVRGLTGAQAAKEILHSAGLDEVRIQRAKGFLGDFYNPANKTLNLSPEVYDVASIAAVGVAAHEAGHALQHQAHYFPLAIRSSLVPAAQFGNNLWFFLFLGGFLFHWTPLMWIGVGIYGCAALFTLVTLPVEFNASGRALRVLENSAILYPDELRGARAVLSAAALTYVAAALMALLQLLRLVLLTQRRS